MRQPGCKVSGLRPRVYEAQGLRFRVIVITDCLV